MTALLKSVAIPLVALSFITDTFPIFISKFLALVLSIINLTFWSSRVSAYIPIYFSCRNHYLSIPVWESNDLPALSPWYDIWWVFFIIFPKFPLHDNLIHSSTSSSLWVHPSHIFLFYTFWYKLTNIQHRPCGFWNTTRFCISGRPPPVSYKCPYIDLSGYFFCPNIHNR